MTGPCLVKTSSGLEKIHKKNNNIDNWCKESKDDLDDFSLTENMIIFNYYSYNDNNIQGPKLLFIVKIFPPKLSAEDCVEKSQFVQNSFACSKYVLNVIFVIQKLQVTWQNVFIVISISAHTDGGALSGECIHALIPTSIWMEIFWRLYLLPISDGHGPSSTKR